MVHAIVLLKVERSKINNIAQTLSEIEGIAEVYSVSGRYDLIALIRVNTNEEMSTVVTEHMLKIQGIKDSETMLAFRSYSKHNLEAMFSVGME